MGETTGEYAFESNRNYLIFFFVAIFAVSFGLPFVSIIGKDLSLTYNPAVINGVLTATAILFGFAANEIRRIKSYRVRLYIMLPIMFCLMAEVQSYLNDTLRGENPAILTLYLSTSVFLLSIFYIMFVTIVRELGELSARILKEPF